MMPDIAELREALKACVDLIEGWAYGPLFKEAGIRWPGGVCCADALVNAKRLLEDEQSIGSDYLEKHYGMKPFPLNEGGPLPTPDMIIPDREDEPA